jgi:UDPglucose 6-dehydrogenase
VQHVLDGDLSGKKIAVLGLTFKANTDDIREAPALSVVPALLGMGAQVFLHDPKAIPSAHAQLKGAHQCLTFEEALADAEACVVLTEWDEYRRIGAPSFKKLMKKPIILDFRNLYSDSAFLEVGVKLLGVGRAPPFGVDVKDERAASVA